MEKKINLGPLQLDKKTIAKLDKEQLEKIKGGSVIGNPGTITPGTSGACTRNSCRTGTSCSSTGITETDE